MRSLEVELLQHLASPDQGLIVLTQLGAFVAVRDGTKFLGEVDVIHHVLLYEFNQHSSEEGEESLHESTLVTHVLENMHHRLMRARRVEENGDVIHIGAFPLLTGHVGHPRFVGDPEGIEVRFPFIFDPVVFLESVQGSGGERSLRSVVGYKDILIRFFAGEVYLLRAITVPAEHRVDVWKMFIFAEVVYHDVERSLKLDGISRDENPFVFISRNDGKAIHRNSGISDPDIAVFFDGLECGHGASAFFFFERRIATTSVRIEIPSMVRTFQPAVWKYFTVGEGGKTMAAAVFEDGCHPFMVTKRHEFSAPDLEGLGLFA